MDPAKEAEMKAKSDARKKLMLEAFHPDFLS